MKKDKIFTALTLILVATSTRLCCQVQADDPDCRPSSQRVLHDLQSDGAFAQDKTMQDIVAYAIDKCSDNSGVSSYKTRMEANIEAVIAAGNAQARIDAAMLKVWDATHDPEKTEQAREIAEHVYRQIESAELAKSSILAGAALDDAINKVDADLDVVKLITNDHYNFLVATDRAEFHNAWKTFSDDQLNRFKVEAERLRPSVDFAVNEADGALNPNQKMKEEQAFLHRVISDVATEQERRASAK